MNNTLTIRKTKNELNFMQTNIMGILNVTPDSFYDGGKWNNLEKAINRAIEMEKEGANIIDIGGESSRPGAKPITEDEEIRRVIPVVEILKDTIKIPISLDTSRSKILEKALSITKIAILNDIYAFRRDPKIAEIAASHNIYTVIMHMKGNPQNMQDKPHYENIIDEIMSFFEERINFAIKRGIKENKIIIDPGIGFGKTTQGNIEILKNIPKFKKLGFPILLGPSRKSFIGNILEKPAEQRLIGTIACIAYCALEKVEIVRVHDIKETKDTLLLISAIKE